VLNLRVCLCDDRKNFWPESMEIYAPCWPKDRKIHPSRMFTVAVKFLQQEEDRKYLKVRVLSPLLVFRKYERKISLSELIFCVCKV
jgi:hypothetical protein